MADERRRILDMLSEGKLSVDEAERLLSLVDQPQGESGSGVSAATVVRKSPPRYLRVQVESNEGFGGEESNERVNIRVPMALIRAGMKLPAMMPSGVAEKVNSALSENGIDMDIRKLNELELENLIDALNDFEVDVQDGDSKVRVYVE
jgi:hypothetical protein